jgi:hypothetical protein
MCRNLIIKIIINCFSLYFNHQENKCTKNYVSTLKVSKHVLKRWVYKRAGVLRKSLQLQGARPWIRMVTTAIQIFRYRNLLSPLLTLLLAPPSVAKAKGAAASASRKVYFYSDVGSVSCNSA